MRANNTNKDISANNANKDICANNANKDIGANNANKNKCAENANEKYRQIMQIIRDKIMFDSEDVLRTNLNPFNLVIDGWKNISAQKDYKTPFLEHIYLLPQAPFFTLPNSIHFCGQYIMIKILSWLSEKIILRPWEVKNL